MVYIFNPRDCTYTTGKLLTLHADQDGDPSRVTVESFGRIRSVAKCFVTKDINHIWELQRQGSQSPTE